MGAPASNVTVGDNVNFWLDTERIHYFDGDTGKNLLRRSDDIGTDGREAVDATPTAAAAGNGSGAPSS